VIAAPVAAASAFGAAATEERPAADTLLEKMKSALFERRWEEVVTSADEFLARYPDSPQAVAVAVNRGRALASMPGREAEALAAFQQAGAGSGPLAEEARRLRAQTAHALILAGKPAGRPALEAALSDAARSVRVSAAILASRTDDSGLRAHAARVLRAELPAESSPDLRDEMTLALARVDPAAATGGAAPARTQGAQARWIHLRMTKRSDPNEKVLINLPLSFARALLSTLPDETVAELRGEAAKKGLSWEALIQSLDEAKAQKIPLLSADDGDELVEIWVD